jgi:hypothetical protein
MRLRLGVNATWPLAELRVDDESVSVRLRMSFLRRMFAGLAAHSLQMPLAGACIEPVKGVLPLPMYRGIRLRSQDGRTVVFLCSAKTQSNVLNVLRARGAEIGSPKRFW